MKKEFEKWNNIKQQIHEVGKRKYYHEREVWWCALGVNVGTEQDGSGAEFRRPVVILRGFGADTCLVIPLTTSAHQHPMRVPVGMVDDRQAMALLSQIKVVDTRRLVRKIGYLEKEMFSNLRESARGIL